MYPPESIPPWDNFNEHFEGKPYIQKQMLRNWKLEDWTWKEWSVYMSGYYGIISQPPFLKGDDGQRRYRIGSILLDD